MRKLVVLFPILVATLAACEEPVACTDHLAYAVTIDLEDADGEPVTDATVTYAVDGGSPEACESFQDGTYVCGPEVEGAIRVVAERDGLEASMDFDIAADQCHVIGEAATLVLE